MPTKKRTRILGGAIIRYTDNHGGFKHISEGLDFQTVLKIHKISPSHLKRLMKLLPKRFAHARSP